MTHTIPTWSTPPVAGGWLFHSRTGVAQLARCATLDDVRTRFGSARTLTEQLLGFPLNGGHATKPMVRLIGELLHHRLGPAVAAEALAFVVEIQRMVSTDVIERILRRYLDVSLAVGLPSEGELSDVVARLDAVVGRARASLAVDLCRPQGRETYRRRDAASVGVGHDDYFDWRPSRWFGRRSSWSSQEPASELLEWLLDLGNEKPTPPQIDASDHDQMVALLWDNTHQLLQRHDCPDALREMIRHPYDEATLHLAIRAGLPFYEHARVRRMLLGASRPVLERFAEHSSSQLVVAVLQLGIAGDQRLQWLLAEFECTLWREALPSLGQPNEMLPLVSTTLADPNSPVALIVALLLETPVVHSRFGQVPLIGDDTVAALLSHPESQVRLATAGHVHSAWPDTEAVAAVTSDLLDATGDEWLDGALRSDHPSIVAAAVDRSAAAGTIIEPLHLVCDVIDVAPLVNPELVRASVAWQALVAGTPAVAHSRPTPSWALRHSAYRYPAVVLRMDGASLPGHPGWRVTVPVDRDELLSNADIMGNCSANFDQWIRWGESFLLVVTGPSGERCNAAIHEQRGRFEFGEIKDRFNAPAPAWMEAALLAMLERVLRPARRVAGLPAMEMLPSEPAVRRPKPRRRPGGGARRRPPTRPVRR